MSEGLKAPLNKFLLRSKSQYVRSTWTPPLLFLFLKEK
jgi:hypothetical protein